MGYDGSVLMPFGNARYGANILSITKGATTIVQVDVSSFFAAGDKVRIAAVAEDETGPSLNQDYTILSVSPTNLTLSEDTTLYANYISGGVVSINEQVNQYPPPQLVPYVVTNLANRVG